MAKYTNEKLAWAALSNMFPDSYNPLGAIGNMIDGSFYGVIFTDSYGRYAEMFPAGGGYFDRISSGVFFFTM